MRPQEVGEAVDVVVHMYLVSFKGIRKGREGKKEKERGGKKRKENEGIRRKREGVCLR